MKHLTKSVNDHTHDTIIDENEIWKILLEKNGVIGETILVSERQRGKHSHQKPSILFENKPTNVEQT